MPRTFDRKAPPAERWRQVAATAVGLVERIRKAKADDTIHGQRWQDGMLAHYEARARQLLSQPPPGQQAFARALRKRLDKR